MTEPDDFGLSALETLAHVGDGMRSIRHVAFWKNWTAGVFANRPRLIPREERSADPSDLGATHEFDSARSVRVGCSLLLPARGRARAGLVVAHGEDNVPMLAESSAAWQSVADRGGAVLIPRGLGF